MRRIVPAFVAGITLVGLLAAPAAAQFRRFAHPVAPRQPAFGFAGSFNRSLPFSTVMHAAPGSFNPNTGAFVPNSGGPFVLSARNGFEPVRGQFTPNPTGNFTLRVRESFNPNTGTFVPSATGNIVLRERGNFTPTNGSFTNTATGSVNLLNGNFVPGTNGASTLFSNGSFVPNRGVFVQSPFGNFTLVTKEAFDPARNAFVPSPTGNFSFTVRGNFLFGTTPAQLASLRTSVALGNTGFFSPLNLTTPSARALVNAVARDNLLLTRLGFNTPFTNPLLTQATNPYSGWNNPFYNPYLNTGYNPYTAYASAGYSAPYSAPYSSGNYPSNPYPANSYASAPANNGIPAYTPSTPQPKPSVMAAYGIPTENGVISWPLAFRLMAPDQKKELLDPFESELQVAATQAAADKANPAIVRRARQNLEDVRTWLTSHRSDMAAGTFRDGERFLQTVEKALKTMNSAN